MRLLILSCNTGEGHNSAAKAIKDRFELMGSECDIKDALAFWSPEKSKLISKGHVFIYRRLPKLFGVSYRFEENHPPKDGEDSLMYDLVIKGCEALYNFLLEEKYNAVICTHVFPSMMITELRRRYNYFLKTYFVATDYTCSPGVSQTSLDGYFIPHEKLIGEFAANGINRKNIIPTGIPVRECFYSHTDMKEAKRQLNLPENKNIVLLMCGSMGCGPIKELTEFLPEQMPENAMLIVICGNNARLYKSLVKLDQPENIRILGFTDKISLYMDSASLVLTKPGGLSTTEASAKALPMIFIDAVPGCETRNIDFFIKNGYADMRKGVLELCDLVCDYLEHPDKAIKISQALKNGFHGNAAQKIFDYVYGDVNHPNDKLQKLQIQ